MARTGTVMPWEPHLKLRIVMTTTMLVALCAPSAAFAAVRSGYDDDPRDVPVNIDPIAPPNLQPDIARVAASYDDAAGTVRLEDTYYEALPATGYEVGETLYISNPSDPVAPSASVTWFYDVDQTSQFALNQATMQVPGLAGQLRTTWQLSADRRTLTADFASPAIAQRNWTQVTNLYGGYDAWD